MTMKPVALVTGAGGGLGGAIARALAAKGFALALNDIHETPALSALRAEIGDAEIAIQDIGAVSELEAFVERVHALLGRLDCLVNNAGVSVLSRRYSRGHAGKLRSAPRDQPTSAVLPDLESRAADVEGSASGGPKASDRLDQHRRGRPCRRQCARRIQHLQGRAVAYGQAFRDKADDRRDRLLRGAKNTTRSSRPASSPRTAGANSPRSAMSSPISPTAR